jgi:hypothetical protein
MKEYLETLQYDAIIIIVSFCLVHAVCLCEEKEAKMMNEEKIELI